MHPQSLLEVSAKYDSNVDGLILYLNNVEHCLDLRNNVFPKEFYYGKDIILRCDENGLVHAISILNASEYLA